MAFLRYSLISSTSIGSIVSSKPRSIHSVKDVSERLGVSTWSLYNWIKEYSTPPSVRQADQDQAARIKRLESELRRVTEERDILKKAAAYFAKESR
jgi:transposase